MLKWEKHQMSLCLYEWTQVAVMMTICFNCVCLCDGASKLASFYRLWMRVYICRHHLLNWIFIEGINTTTRGSSKSLKKSKFKCLHRKQQQQQISKNSGEKKLVRVCVLRVRLKIMLRFIYCISNEWSIETWRWMRATYFYLHRYSSFPLFDERKWMKSVKMFC